MHDSPALCRLLMNLRRLVICIYRGGKVHLQEFNLSSQVFTLSSQGNVMNLKFPEGSVSAKELKRRAFGCRNR